MSWTDGELGDFLTLKRGYDLPHSNRKAGDVPVVSSSGITGWHNEKKAEPPGVITGRCGTIGEVFYVDQPYWPLNTALYVIDFKNNVPRFVAYFLREKLKNYQSDKAAVPGVDRKVLHKLPARRPDTQIQQAIVRTLSAYDNLIENNRRRIALLEEAARQLYKEWFVRFRFPGHEHVKIIDGVPEGWEPTRLGNIISTNSRSYSAKSLPEHLRYIDISAVNKGEITLSFPIPSEEAPGRAGRIAGHGDVIWSNVRPNLRAYALVMNPDKIDVFSTGFTVLSSAVLPFSFLYLHTTTDAFVNYLMNHTTGASYPAVRPDDFERAEMIMPPANLLTAFHELCESNFKLMAVLRQQADQLATARDLLLPKLMSGAITV